MFWRVIQGGETCVFGVMWWSKLLLDTCVKSGQYGKKWHKVVKSGDHFIRAVWVKFSLWLGRIEVKKLMNVNWALCRED